MPVRSAADACGRGIRRPLFGMAWVMGIAVLALLAIPPFCSAADPDLEALVKQLRTGDYSGCIRGAAAAIDRRAFGEEWYLVKAEAELASGSAPDAWETIQAGLQRYSWSIRLRYLGMAAARESGHAQQAAIWLAEILDQAGRAPWRYVDPDNLVALGRAALANGIDAKQILEQLYDRAQRQNPKHRDALLAIGELSLQKQDYELATETFRTATKEYPGDPDLQCGLARALEQSDPERAAGAIAAALSVNPKHVPSLLFRAEAALNAEQYDQAREYLETVLSIHAHQVDAWALWSVLSRLQSDPLAADVARDMALDAWSDNPRVDHLIGKKLSQKYRFAEGAANQQAALRLDPAYLPAKAQLVQDWLRLGKNDEAWKLAEAVHQTDGYDVQIFNLLELRDKLARYRSLERDGFVVRMESREADVYGEDVLDLLVRAKQTLCKKYGLELKDPISVEIFPEPNDFAVRTFGLPGASGYLGVCFGRVITANSPASQAERPANWQAVLWHEFCHVVTLELTHNRMPRWLSEGLSVYEERQANPAWGERMNPRYREWILSGRLTPLGEMSGAFLHPESGQHLQFAYYQASLIVEYLLDVYGLDAMKQVLADLAEGLPVNESLHRRMADVAQLDQEFQAYAQETARAFGPDLDWGTYDLTAILSDDDPSRIERWCADHPDSVAGLTAWTQALIERREFEKALVPVQRMIAAAPEHAGGGNFYHILADLYRELGRTGDERRILTDYVPRTDDDLPAMLRLLELEVAAGDWPGAVLMAQRIKAVNPLLPRVHQSLATAAENLQQDSLAAGAWEARLALGVDDEAEAYFRIARLYRKNGDPRARRAVLNALERAPRYRAAQELLLEIVGERPVSAVMP